MLPCVICNGPVTFPESWNRKSCSSECARENDQRVRQERYKQDRLLRPEKYVLKNRLKAERRQAAVRADRGKRSCRVCGTDISERYGNARYCSNRCRRPKIARNCLRCGEPIPGPRLVCDQCKSNRMRPNYIDNAKTFEERLARITRTKQASKKQHTLVRAANQMYRELQGKTKKQSTTRLVRVLRADIRGIYLACIRVPALPLPTCVVCGIALTSSRKRILCGSQFCKEERQRERSRCHYVGGRLSETPRMIAAAERYPLGRRTGKTNGKFRDPKPQQRPKKQKSSPERSQREYAVYVAMRELNLLPIKEDRS